MKNQNKINIKDQFTEENGRNHIAMLNERNF